MSSIGFYTVKQSAQTSIILFKYYKKGSMINGNYNFKCLSGYSKAGSVCYLPFTLDINFLIRSCPLNRGLKFELKVITSFKILWSLLISLGNQIKGL